MPDGIRAVTVPKWGLAMTEGTVVAWYANEGDQVNAGTDLVEIETPKITNLYESPPPVCCADASPKLGRPCRSVRCWPCSRRKKYPTPISTPLSQNSPQSLSPSL